MGVALRHGNLQPDSTRISGRRLPIAGPPFWPTLIPGLQKYFATYFVIRRTDLFSNINQSQINLFASFCGGCIYLAIPTPLT